MNRLTARGIALEASTGPRRVLVLTREADVPDAVLWMTSAGFEPEVARITRAKGRQGIGYCSGGTVEFRDPATGHHSARGHSVDLVYVDDWPRTYRLEQELAPAVAARGGQVIWT